MELLQKSRLAHSYFRKKTVLDKTIFSPEHKRGLGQEGGVPCANTGIKHCGKGHVTQEEILKPTVTLYSRNKEIVRLQP